MNNTPPLFHVGQLVTPLAGTAWVHSEDAKGMPAPALDKVYEVATCEYFARFEGWFISLVELSSISFFRETEFAPVDGTPAEAIAELLTDALTPVLA